MHRALPSFVVLLVVCAFTRAHPIPKTNHDRTIIVHLTPEAVTVDYRLELDEYTAFDDIPRSETAHLKNIRDLPPVFLRFFAPVLARNLDATIDGKELVFTCIRKQFQHTDSVRCDYLFEAKWKPEPDRPHNFALREGNWHNDSVSKITMSLYATGGIDLREEKGPDAGTLEQERRRTLKTTFTVEADPSLASVKLGLPPDIEPERAGPEPGQIVAVHKMPGIGEAALPRPTVNGQEGLGKSKPRGVASRTNSVSVPDVHDTQEPASESPRPRGMLDLILDSRLGLGLALLFAAGFGAVHALTPGHGKTLVAAYLVGERGTLGHAFLLGLVTTLTHTGAVLIIAGVLFFFCDSKVPSFLMPVLSLLGGLMVTGLGLWLLLRRLAGQADHFHFGSSDHHHGHGHSHGGLFHSHGGDAADHVHSPPTGVGLRPLIWLGISGGIIPCGDAIAILTVAIAKGFLRQALPVLLAFSAGLASTLVAIGIGVVFARRLGDVQLRESERWKKVVAALPIISAVVVTALGLLLCYDSFHGEH